ncbi:MAG: FkbM family methyltransferase [Candidatus Dependentiae bacterium]
MKQIKHHQILETVKPYLPNAPIVVEAGAFDGADTKKMALLWPEGTIHAFEPVPKNFELLKNNTVAYKNICCYPLALSNTTGYATFYSAINPAKPDKPCQAGSLLAPKERLSHSPMVYQETIQVPAITLDDWAEKEEVNQVDFLWLDMQGHELSVIKSSPVIMTTVKAIYTEVHFIEAYEGQSSYQELKNYLESIGFTMVARDFTEPPSWFFGNALFVRL